MDGAVVGVDDEFAVGPLGIFVGADQKFQGEMFEHEIVGGLEIIIGKRAVVFKTLTIQALHLLGFRSINDTGL